MRVLGLPMSAKKILPKTHFLVVGLFAFVTFALPLINNVGTARADTSLTPYLSDSDAQHKATAIRYYSMLVACSGKIKTEIKGDHITKGPRWWINAGQSIVLGEYFDAWGDENGITACNGEDDDSVGWLTGLFEAFDINVDDNRAALEDILGYTCVDTNGADTVCTNNSANDPDSSNGWVKRLLAASPYFKGKAPASGTDIDAMNYWVALQVMNSQDGCSFQAGSGTTSRVTYSEVSDDDGSLSDVSGSTNGSSVAYPAGGISGSGSNLNRTNASCTRTSGAGTGRDNAQAGLAYYLQENSGYPAAYAQWTGKVNGCASFIDGYTLDGQAYACADGWLHPDTLGYCLDNYRDGTSANPTSAAASSNTPYRNACFDGQRLKVDASTGASIGTVCYNTFWASAGRDATAACIVGAQRQTCTTYSQATLQNACNTGKTLNATTNTATNGGVSGGSSTACDPGQTLDNDGNCVTPGDNCPLEPGDSMRWLGCSIFFMLKGAAERLTAMLDDLLFVDPATLFANDTQTAANIFRNVGLIVVVLAGLIMVISQAMGLEILDAYTVRKLLPRMGITLVGIALAWPILRFFVTFVNDIGGLVYDVLLQIPGDAAIVGSSADLGTGIGGFLVGIMSVGGALWVMGPMALTFIATIFLALLVGYLVLALRQVVIFVAVLIAPLAIASNLIPGGEKLWKFWRTTFVTTLLMYPIIMGFIGAGAALAYLLGAHDGTMPILAIVVYFAPFFMIPFAFKLAGGLMSTIFSIANDRNRGLFDRLSKGRQAASAARWQHRSGKMQQAYNQRAISTQRGLKDYANRSGRLGSFAALRAASMLDGYKGNLEAETSAQQAATAKEMNDQIATGMDDEIRGLTVDKRGALTKGKLEAQARSDGSRYATDDNGREYYRIKSDGSRQFKSLGGSWINESSVDRGYSRWGKNTNAKQVALSYEMRKAMTNDEVTGIHENYAELASGKGSAWNLTETEAAAAWTGAKFENQNQHLNLKGRNWTGELADNGKAYAKEAYEKRNSSAMGSMSAKAIMDLKEAYDIGDEETKRYVTAVAENFMQRGSTMQAGPDAEEGKVGVQPGTLTGDARAQSGSYSAAPHVQEAIRDLASHVKVYDNNPPIEIPPQK